MTHRRSRIESPSNPLVKRMRLLREKRHRRAEKRDRLISILAEDGGDDLEAVSITNDIERLERQLQESPLYGELVSAQSSFSLVLNAVNEEINACIGGKSNSSCAGDSGSCGGCKH